MWSPAFFGLHQVSFTRRGILGAAGDTSRHWLVWEDREGKGYMNVFDRGSNFPHGSGTSVNITRRVWEDQNSGERIECEFQWCSFPSQVHR